MKCYGDIVWEVKIQYPSQDLDLVHSVSCFFTGRKPTFKDVIDDLKDRGSRCEDKPNPYRLARVTIFLCDENAENNGDTVVKGPDVYIYSVEVEGKTCEMSRWPILPVMLEKEGDL